MKVLWVNTNFLHPTTKGGQIRTLEMLRHLHRRHEIHYVAVEDPSHPEGPARATEYATRAYPFRHAFVEKSSPVFAWQLAKSVFESAPVGTSRFHIPALGRFLEELADREHFDRAVCDFLHPASYFPHIESAVLFQHNVETMIWRRHAEHAPDPLRRWYFEMQAERMLRHERSVCQTAGHVVAVSEQDACTMRKLFGMTRGVSAIPTGVDVERFSPPSPAPPKTADLVFVGSMDWLPNIDGIHWFVREVLPRIRRKRPDCVLTIVGRVPPPSITALAEKDSQIQVTGTVADVRPYLWGSKVSIVPLRIGGGTRLKIYESMAARTPVVSTGIGAEGLQINPPADIRIADSPEDFADACCELLSDAEACERQGAAAWDMVSAEFSWEHVAACLDRILERAPAYC